MTVRTACAVGVMTLAACAAPANVAAVKSAPVVAGAGAAAGAPGAGGDWVYEIGISADAHVLDVSATFPAGSGDALEGDSGSSAFVDGIRVQDGASWRAVAKGGSADTWTVPCARGCVVTYRFRLDDAARASGDVDNASTMHDAIEAPPSTWLLRPSDGDDSGSYRFHVTMQGGAGFATGVHPVPGMADTYGARILDFDSAPYTVFGKMRKRTLARKEGTIEVATLDGRLTLTEADIDHWIDISARAVESYYGRFPVPRLLLLIAPATFGHEDVEGRTLAGGGSTILLGVSPDMKPADIARDWVLTHEMTHLTMPTLPRQNHWLEEGSATYVEPIARAQVGTIPESEVWKGLVEGLPNGEPEVGDEGLDNTHTWGRTYWGGALFCFLADVAIRERTGNRASLQTALRGVLAFGSGERRATIDEVLRAGDAATGTKVLEELHARLGEKGERTDLDAVWKKLGVREERGAIAVDDGAPEAGVRKAMTRP